MFLISLFLQSSLSLENRYSVVPPFEFTNISEIGNWTLRGSAANMKKYIRLTSTIDGDYGSLCQRVPTLFTDWQFEVEIKAFNNRYRGGEGFWFYFTKEVCPEMLLQYTGFCVWVNTSKTDSKGRSPIFFLNNENQVIDFNDCKPLGYIKLRNTTDPFRLRITKKGKTLKVDHASDLGTGYYEECFHLTNNSLLDYGYFTFSAITGSSLYYDNNDLYSIRTFALSAYTQKEFDYDISAKNRKVIEAAVDVRRTMKQERRAKMVNMLKYNEDATNHKNTVNGGTYDIKDAFKLIKEAEERGSDTVSVLQLKAFINSYIETTITKAMKKIDLAFDKFDETKLDMNDLWGYLKTQLLDLSMETKQSLKNLENECLSFAKSINLQDLNQTSLQQSVSMTNEANDSKISKFLFYIMILEIIGYVIFFMYKRHKTHGFIKVD
ncbi:Vesicular integral-membrane protein VIP36 [Tritrichomonas musculus]|uniref:Vesicular integral-membrane protein VIP36 n=1 Tax=Tritrichomonas musculus TaxID=1915356 RepID=A0ABR2IQ46_9EUKA